MSKKFESLPALLESGNLEVKQSLNLTLSRQELIDLIIDDLSSDLQDEIDKAQNELTEIEKLLPSPAAVAEECDPIKYTAFVKQCQKHKLTPKFIIQYKIINGFTEGDHEIDGVEITLRVSTNITRTNSKLLRDYDNKIKPYQERLAGARTKFNKFASQNKKIKNQITRKFLNATKEGSNIVTNLDVLKEKFREEVINK